MSENEIQTCPKCGAPAREGDVFCRGCGAKHSGGVSGTKPAPEVKRVCSNCGNTLRPAARFCDLCGEECVKIRYERRRGKRKRNGCSLILAAVLLWLAAGVSAIVIYDAARNTSFKEVLTSIRENFFSSGSGDEEAKEEPDAASGSAVSEDPYETAISADSLPVVTPIAEDGTDIPRPDLRPNSEDSSNFSINTDDTKPAEDTLVSPLDVTAESEDISTPKSEDAAPTESEDKTAPAAGGQQDPSAWTEQDAEGYSSVDADDRFFTSSQTPSLRGTVTGDHVRVRSAPNTASRIKRQLDNGAEVELVRRFSSGNEGYYWFEVRDSAGSGWIYGEFIKPETGDGKVPPAPSSDMENSAAETVINTSP